MSGSCNGVVSSVIISLKCVDTSMLWTTHDIGLWPTGVDLNSLCEICASLYMLETSIVAKI